MNYEKVIIKQIPEDNFAAVNLKNYNRSRFPGCLDNFQVAQLADGRFLTGIDPKGPDVMAIKDEELRKEKEIEMQDLQRSLEISLNADLSPRSEFWETFFMTISTDQDLVLSKYNPRDVITYHALVANGYVAPTKSAVSNPDYRAAKYYCHVDEVEVSQKLSSQKLRDKARAELYKISEDKEMLLLIGSYLEGGKYKKGMKENQMYSMISDYIDDKKNPENVTAFLKAMQVSPEDLQYKVTVETAIRKKIIKFKEGQYYRGGVNLGKNAVEVLRNLKLPDYTNEFVAIHDEVNNLR